MDFPVVDSKSQFGEQIVGNIVTVKHIIFLYIIHCKIYGQRTTHKLYLIQHSYSQRKIRSGWNSEQTLNLHWHHFQKKENIIAKRYSFSKYNFYFSFYFPYSIFLFNNFIPLTYFMNSIVPCCYLLQSSYWWVLNTCS